MLSPTKSWSLRYCTGIPLNVPVGMAITKRYTDIPATSLCLLGSLWHKCPNHNQPTGVLSVPDHVGRNAVPFPFTFQKWTESPAAVRMFSHHMAHRAHQWSQIPHQVPDLTLFQRVQGALGCSSKVKNPGCHLLISLAARWFFGGSTPEMTHGPEIWWYSGSFLWELPKSCCLVQF